MGVMIAGVVLVGLAAGLLWSARRQRRTGLRIALVAVGAVLLVTGAAAAGVYAWALSSTSDSQLARALVWGDSEFGDQDRFPARTMRAATQPVIFAEAEDSPVENFTSAGVPLAEVLEANDSTAFIVLHDDELLYESYFNGSGREATQTSFSVAKSFTATLVGIAIDEGLIGFDDPITQYVPELLDRDTRFSDITVRHLTTMSSGLSFEEGSSPWADPANTYHGTDLRSAVIEEPEIVGPPNVDFHYNDWNVVMLGLILERATAMPLAEYMETRLWQPMGAEADGSWSLDSDEHGFEKSFVGVNGQAIDFAKLGWLYLHDGRNADRQVVPADFVEDATALDAVNDPSSEYQYLWWIDEERSAFFANGDHGQFIYVDPEAELVIVRHGRGPGDVAWIDLFGDLADWLDGELGG